MVLDDMVEELVDVDGLAVKEVVVVVGTVDRMNTLAEDAVLSEEPKESTVRTVFVLCNHIS